jgi:hypothetical protein
MLSSKNSAYIALIKNALNVLYSLFSFQIISNALVVH